MQTVEQLSEQLNLGDKAAVYRAKRALEEMAAAAGAPGKNDERQSLAAALAKAETAKNEKGDAPKYSTKARGEIARALSEVAGDMEVPALKEALKDFDAREMARFALDRMTCQAATDALIEAAVNAVGVEFRVGAINALGRRTGSSVVNALKKCVAERDAEIRLAAAEALANQSDPSADDAIVAAGRQGGYRAALRTSKARVRLAGSLADAGQKDAAKRIYQSIAQSDAAPPQKKVAQSALSQLG